VTTGWPSGLLQDDERKLSRWLASRPDAIYRLRKNMNIIEHNAADQRQIIGWTDEGRCNMCVSYNCDLYGKPENAPCLPTPIYAQEAKKENT